MKYNVGDYVRLRDDLVHDRIYDRITYSKNFKEFLDGILKIQMTTIDGCYLVNNYYLSEKMLEPAFDFDYYKNQKVVVHCDTEEKAEIFCRLMHQNGMKWCGDSSYLEMTNYFGYKSETCYFFNEGTFGDMFNLKVKKLCYQIIEFDDIVNNTYKNKGDKKMKKEFTKSDLKVGYLVELNDGSLCRLEQLQNGYIGFITKDGVWISTLFDTDSYNNNLVDIEDDWFTINKIYDYSNNGYALYDISKRHLLWERKKMNLNYGMV